MSVLLLAGASFLTDISSEMTLTLLPVFLTGTLGVSVATVGLIEGIGESTASLTRLVAGRLSDRQPRRLPLVIAGYGLSALTKPVFALVTGPGLAGVLRFGDRLGKGVRTAPRDAMLADAAAEHRRGLVFGLHRAADTLGASLGLLLAVLVLVSLTDGPGLPRDAFQRLVLVAAVPGFLGVLILLLIREHPARRTGVHPRLLALPRSQVERRYLLVLAIFSLANSSDAFLILRLMDVGESVESALLWMMGMNLVYAAMAVPAGWWSDRIGRRRLLLVGFVLYALVYGGLGLADSPLAVGLLLLAYGAHYGATSGVSRAYLADIAPLDDRGGSFGWYHLVTGIVALPASIVAGVLWTAAGPPAAFVFGSACALLAAALLVTAPERGPVAS